MIFTPVPYQSEAEEAQQLSAGYQYTRYRSPTLFGTIAAVGFFGMSVGFTLIICSFIVYSTSRVWGSTLGRGGLLLLISGSGMLTASALHHFCKQQARQQLMRRLQAAHAAGKLCCRRLRGACGGCCPVGNAATGLARCKATPAAMLLRARGDSTELLMESQQLDQQPPTPV